MNDADRHHVNAHYVLIDYENVKPKDIAILNEAAFKVKLFVGPNQGKIPVGIAMALQAMGNSAEYIPLETAGRNALDFHIAYYIGTLSARDPSSVFHIISKDSGFDPLILHLKGKGIAVDRSTCIASMPGLTPLPELEAQVQSAIKDLTRRGSARPRTKKTLLSTLHAHFRKQLSEHQLLALLDSLCKQGVVMINGTKVTYELPVVAAPGTVAADRKGS